MGGSGVALMRSMSGAVSVESHRVTIPTRGNAQVVDVTPSVEAALRDGRISDGTVTLFVVGSTAALSTTEYEPGLAETDLAAFYERVAPEDGHYEHEVTWNDDNGHSHVRATFTGPSITVPLVDGALTLGTWQQIVLLDFDTRPRERKIVVQVIGV